MTRVVGVPGVRVDDIEVVERADHVEIDGEDLQHRLGLGEVGRHLVPAGAIPCRPERMDPDIGKRSELTNELLDMHSGPAVDVRRPLSRQNPCSQHRRQPRAPTRVVTWPTVTCSASSLRAGRGSG